MKVQVKFYEIDIAGEKLHHLGDGEANVPAKSRQDALNICQTMFGPVRGSTGANEWHFLTSDGILVVVTPPMSLSTPKA